MYICHTLLWVKEWLQVCAKRWIILKWRHDNHQNSIQLSVAAPYHITLYRSFVQTIRSKLFSKAST